VARLKEIIAFALPLLVYSQAVGQTHLAKRVLTIPVEVNHVEGTFLVDTGADCTIIDSGLARQLGLKPSETATLQRNYSVEEVSTAVVDHFRVGPQTWSDLHVAVMDLSALSRAQPTHISGVLGTDLLRALIVKLSYATGTVQVITDRDSDVPRIALKKTRSRYLMPVTIGSSTFDLLLDSGTNMTALSNSAWRKLAPRKMGSVLEGVLSSGSPPGSFIACTLELRVGEANSSLLSLRNFPLRVISPSPSGSFADTGFEGILGGDVLEHFIVTLDLQHDSIYLKPDAAYRPDPYEFTTVGMQFYKASEDAFFVAAVWKSSPAEAAGIMPGDRILSVNRYAAADLGLETLSNRLHGPVGTPIAMEVERAGRRFAVSMKTQQMLCCFE
jgi:predicted aspartyl protease